MSYRKYFSATLPREQFKHTNMTAPGGLRFCNGSCQDFRDRNCFSGKIIKPICNDCRSLVGRIDKAIANKEFTLEAYQKDNSLLKQPDGSSGTVSTTRICGTCHETKEITLFEGARNTCKSCRAIQTKARNSNIETEISDIMKLSGTLTTLKQYLATVGKDKLILLVSHFKVGRKSTDSKAQMIENTVNHFKNLINPRLCSEGCGSAVQETGACPNCQRKKANAEKRQNTGPQPMTVFDRDFDSIAQKILDDNIPIEDHQFNKVQTFRLCRHYGVNGVLQQNSKAQMIENTVNHFKNLINPRLCSEGCGSAVQETGACPNCQRLEVPASIVILW